MSEQAPDFPSELLVADGGTLSGHGGNYRIAIRLKPFTFDGEDINAELVIENLLLDARKIENLQGQEVTMPANPEAGYVESSLYLWGVHNPVDVLRICFFGIVNGQIEGVCDVRFVFEYEGLCKNLDKTLALSLAVEPE